jgi:hypothetical protein
MYINVEQKTEGQAKKRNKRPRTTAYKELKKL